MTTSTRPGDVLAGRYRLIDLLTESDGGRFWRAHDNVLERYVALHVIPDDDPRAPLLMAAARESATVLDARILRVLDAEIVDGKCFVVNEWGTGTSLDILVTAGGPLGPRRAAWLAAEVAGAVATAHSRGVAHGRLNPENVLIDRLGAVRLIGLCVDAALHGLPAGRLDHDRQDLAGLLYCSLTATWPGPSSSIVPAAPHAHDEVLAPRQVRAGVPRPLDQLWTDITETAHQQAKPGKSGRSKQLLQTRQLMQVRRWVGDNGAGPSEEVTTAQAVQDRLLEFLGDTTGLTEALAGSIPPINEVRPVVLPQVPEMTVRDFERTAAPFDDAPADEPEVTEEGSTELDELDELEEPDEPDEPPIPSVADIVDMPTEAGMPVFGDPEDGDEVAWLRARSVPPPPPPPFDEPPERPLFAPEPPEGAPVRRPRTDVPEPVRPSPPAAEASLAAAGFWPWEDTGAGPDLDHTGEHTADQDAVPGRSWLRLAMVVAACLALVVAVAVAFNLGRGRTPLGAERDPTRTPSLTTPPEPTTSPLPDVTVRAFDPQSEDGAENDADVPLAVDGNASTSWSTSTYRDQLGPALPALKEGVGVYLDLGVVREVARVDLDLVGTPTSVELYVTDEVPDAVPTGPPAAAAESAGPDLTLEPASAKGPGTAVTGRYVVVWFTSLPVVSGGFRAGLAEVVVRGR
ncbi:protein kinase family protein [Nocardioides silvaticus]|uniref:protein kinase family protein n=1 Tax=Nocardioides silvaticus TaxID=2201891 RepID=UPI0011B1FD57|nr:protein kinase family protein [Nocardioides silvaticus]